MLLRKPVFEYYLRRSCIGMLWVLGVYAGLFLLGVILTAVTVVEDGGSTSTINISFGGAEGIFFIAFMIACMSDFTSEFHFMSQHGVSRRSAFVNFVLHIVATSAIISVVLYLSTTLFGLIGALPSVQIATQRTFLSAYGAWLDGAGAVVGVLTNLLFDWAMFIVAGVLGYVVTILFYRMGKVGKTIFWGVIIVSGPFLTFLNHLTDGRVAQLGLWFWNIFIGHGDVANPWNGIGVFLVLALIGLVPCWLLIRRCALKK